MNSLIRRAQQVGLARAICVLLLFALVPLRLADPRLLHLVITQQQAAGIRQMLDHPRARLARDSAGSAPMTA